MSSGKSSSSSSLRDRLRSLTTSERLIRVACVLGLIALPLMVWSLFDPHVWPVLLALSVGQGIGTLSFLLFVIVVIRDLAVSRKLKDQPDVTE
jgi:hypothetical protein